VKPWSLDPVEFEIDEEPVEVAEAGGASGSSDEAVDFISRLGSLIAECERLAVTVKMLEREGGDGGELEKLIRRILPVLDGFERILESGRDYPEGHEIANWLKSVEGLHFRLKNLLEKFGLFGIEAIGQPVNLDLHEVVEYRPSPDHEPDTVIAVRQRGYVFLGRLIRDAQVVVAR
jgi:molecular chaperone GrpE (heat shock protein)